ncbi:hypothetical protein [Vandammella animalimorsus]|uniref:hypothetical protein n=1 Tax=Vandammella animalimorsus TaxID=2029117 RepID=UPI0011C37219|nr:hypothetical protein [Vandammella animalimorsus]
MTTSVDTRPIGSSLLQIIAVNEIKRGSKEGRDWELQDAECILLNDDGSPSMVGVLMIPKHLRGEVKPGVYSGSFTLRPDLRSRRIEAVLVGLTPHISRPAKPAVA